MTIQYVDFEKVDIRVGVITACEDFPQARKPAYKLTIDFGPEVGVKHSSAQITTLYGKSDLIDRKILAVVNFPEKQIGPFVSQVLTLGTPNESGDVILADPGQDAVVGARLF